MIRTPRFFWERKIVLSGMKWILSVLAVGLTAFLIAYRADSASQPDSTNQNDSLAIAAKNNSAKSFGRVIPNNAFSIGENLEFRVRYGMVVAGSSRMGVDDTVRINGNLCYKLVTEAYSSKFFSNFFKVEDRVISYADKAGLFSWFFEQHLREGRYKADRWAQYNQRENLVYTHKKDTLKVPPYVNDILSSFYLVRTQKLVVGDTLFIQNHANKKIYPMAVIVHGKENIEVKAGKFRCLVVEPVVTEGGLFKHEGKLTIWFSDDEKKIPVQMKSKVSFLGSITAELTDIHGVDQKKLARW